MRYVSSGYLSVYVGYKGLFMKQEPLISVIIPVYNVKEYLYDCIDSIKKQTYKNLEVIIVDDGSNDGSEKLCDMIEVANPTYLVIHKENGGLSDARNVGIEYAKGDYISFLDSDDIISPVFYEMVVKSLSNANAEMVAIKCPTHFWDGDAVDLSKTISECNSYEISAYEALINMFYLQIATGAPFKIISRAIVKQVRFPKGYYYEDIATTYKFFLKSNNVVIINGDLYGYRKRKDSIIRQEFSQRKMTILKVTHQIVEDIKKQNDKVLNKAVAYRVFSPLYSVFLQVPQEDTKSRKALWKEILKYRKSVLFEKHLIRKKDRTAAALTYLGMSFSYYIGRRFGQKGTMAR